jgi:hypothetical protein
MTDADYRRVLEGAFQKFAAKFRQREELDADLLKLRQFIHATVNMLPDEDRRDYEAQLEALANQMTGLTEAVRDVLKLASVSGGFVTATQVRDHLLKANFDFSRYSSNPLASVNTTLKRFKEDEVETTQTEDGVAAYRWRERIPAWKAGTIAKLRRTTGTTIGDWMALNDPRPSRKRKE